MILTQPILLQFQKSFSCQWAQLRPQPKFQLGFVEDRQCDNSGGKTTPGTIFYVQKISAFPMATLGCIDKTAKSKFEVVTPPELCSGQKLAIW